MPAECTAFLQWALPRLGLAWPGYQRVRRQVCRRLGQRIQALRLPGLLAYRDWLEAHPDEWAEVDRCCLIPISRFFRDRPVWEWLGKRILPRLAAAAAAAQRPLRAWCAGCASGEEAYSLRILWRLGVEPQFPAVPLELAATDLDPHLLARAAEARYRASSLREVPPPWTDEAFEREPHGFRLRPEFRTGVEFRLEDLRERVPAGPFDLVLCRNLAFTYFDEALRHRTLDRLRAVLRPGGALLIGRRERLPDGLPASLRDEGLGIFVLEACPGR